MKKTIVNIAPAVAETPRTKRVAAYARVSCGKDTMMHSLAAQIDYYRDYIMMNPEWRFAGVYADESKTGTKDNREQFQLLLTECRSGNIDMVITKSISRFARNTVTLLETVRELKSLGIDVFFEEQNIYTLSAEGEVMLTLLASFAQAESLSCSDNCKWRIRKGFEEGRASTCTMLGYRLVNGEITLIEEEAEIAKRIFDLYLAGCGLQKIANTLNEEGMYSIFGNEWHPTTVRKVLTNEKYCGDLLLQKVYRENHLTKRKCHNTGELPQYFVEDDHPAVVTRQIFMAVQDELKRRAKEKTQPVGSKSSFTGKIRCSCCGKNYRRKTTPYNTVWCCSTYNSKGKKYCPDSKVIPEETLKRAATEILKTDGFSDEAFETQICTIEAHPGNLLRFIFIDGSTTDYVWKDRSRSESWTDEMKAAAAKKAKERYASHDK